MRDAHFQHFLKLKFFLFYFLQEDDDRDVTRCDVAVGSSENKNTELLYQMSTFPPSVLLLVVLTTPLLAYGDSLHQGQLSSL